MAVICMISEMYRDRNGLKRLIRRETNVKKEKNKESNKSFEKGYQKENKEVEKRNG